MLRVLTLLPYPLNRAPGQRFRIEQWAPLMLQEGVDLHFSPFLTSREMDFIHRPGHMASKIAAVFRGQAKRALELIQAGQFDAVLVHRWATFLGPAWLEPLVAKRLPLVFDFDDAIFVPAASRANSWTIALKPRGKTAAICRAAQHVTVGNEYLASFARPISRAVTVVPTTIDTDSYSVVQHEPNPRPIVGWSGSLTSGPYLTALQRALAGLRKQVDFELRVIGAELSMEGVDIRCVPWRPDTEVEDLRAFDVGLMPIPDDEWARGKCGLKALQYMALGIPPVVSPVGVNATIVRDGINGFHARNDEEWIDRIRLLLGDPALRHQLGAEARRTVEQGYSAHAQAPRLARILREAASDRVTKR